MKKFKLRASSGGKLSGKRGLGQTGFGYCEAWVKEQLYSRRNSAPKTKQIIKGLKNEDESIDFIAKFHNYGFLTKNEEFFEDDYFQGTPDIVLKDEIIDVKNSWSPFTFPLFETSVPNDDYFYQGQIYMELTGRKKFKLIYTLTNAPFDLIESEARRYCYAEGVDFDDEILQKFTDEMTFDKVPDNLKIKTFEFEHDPSVIDFLKERIIEARLYIDTLKY